MLEYMDNDKYRKLFEQPMIDPNYNTIELCYINSYLKSKLKKDNWITIDPYAYSASHIPIYDHTLNRRIKTDEGNFNIVFNFPYTDVDKLVESMFTNTTDKNFYIFICNPKLYRYKYLETVSIANVPKEEFKSEESLFRTIHYVNDEYMDAVGEPLFFMAYSGKYVFNLEIYYNFL